MVSILNDGSGIYNAKKKFFLIFLPLQFMLLNKMAAIYRIYSVSLPWDNLMMNRHRDMQFEHPIETCNYRRIFFNLPQKKSYARFMKTCLYM